MNARGATDPRSAGWRLICTNSDRSADSSVGGCDGIAGGGPSRLALGAELCNGDDSDTEALRSGLRRGTSAGLEGMEVGARADGDGSGGTSGAEGSGYWTSSSRNGPQK